MSINQHSSRSVGQHVRFGEGSHVLNVVQQQEKSEIEVGMLQMQILWLLKKQKVHGYELMKELSRLKQTKITQGTLYPTMQRLLELKLVSHEDDGRRKVYSITDKGTKTVASACVDFVSTFGGIFEEFVCMRCAGSEIVFIGKEKKEASKTERSR